MYYVGDGDGMFYIWLWCLIDPLGKHALLNDKQRPTGGGFKQKIMKNGLVLIGCYPMGYNGVTTLLNIMLIEDIVKNS